MIFFEKGDPSYAIEGAELRRAVFSALDKLGPKSKVLAIPPDFSRFHSRAGELLCYVYEYYGEKLKDILPALGTHFQMTETEIAKMFPNVPVSLFRAHNFREDLVTLGIVPESFVEEISEGKVVFDWPAQVNRIFVDGDYDLILSLGQVVPHEVIGMANYNKNIFVGIGGVEGINKSHFLGAVYGMERIMGRALTPVRKLLNYASEHFAKDFPIVYMQTVISEGVDGLRMCGLYIGDDYECFDKASRLSLRVNFKMLDEELKKVVVFLDPEEFKSTWVGNKSIYRTRMAIADDGELIVLAPGLHQFGEDPLIDKLIRKYGYVNTPQVLEYVEKNNDLKENLGVAAHLIHGTSEGRFRITYCPGHLSKKEIEGVGFGYADLGEMIKKYNPDTLKNGWNVVDGEKIYYISNPALGLWAYNERFK
jgi:nickel-dependent lactate racemase